MQQTLFYSDLARELDMRNPMNLNWVLGSVGATLDELGRQWKQEIPEIQSLVIGKGSGEPGRGYLGHDRFRRLTKRQRQALMQQQHADIFAYEEWPEVLAALDLDVVPPRSNDIVRRAQTIGAGGESERHRRLKTAISKDPTLVGLAASFRCVATEYRLPSGDAVDVFFERGRQQCAVEVKAANAPEADIARGLFQCVKYQVVLEKWRAYENTEVDIQTILALESVFPDQLLDLKHALGARVVDSVRSRRRR